MELIVLVLYGAVNLAMVAGSLRGKGTFCRFPFWGGVISLGWFLPMAVGGYFSADSYPQGAYTAAVLFAALCSAAMWVGFSLAANHEPSGSSWLDMPFNVSRLYQVSGVLCIVGFFFQWKLWSLPEEMLDENIWSGATVKYLFFSNVFRIGFIALWLIYLSQRTFFSFKLWLFLIPCFVLLVEAVIFRGRRADMMDLAAYAFVGLWLVRRIALPRWLLISGLAGGVVLINGIGLYRSIMKNADSSLGERISQVMNADFISEAKENAGGTKLEFNNFVYTRQAYADTGWYDYGGFHWNKLIFNYVPAQVVGRELKENLMLQYILDHKAESTTEMKYGHKRMPGTTMTGYMDAFGSFGWFGFIKFIVVGGIMGVLYRHAMQGAFLGQLLYLYLLSTGMHAVTHSTNGILVRVWVYFFAMAFPVLRLARARLSTSDDVAEEIVVQEC